MLGIFLVQYRSVSSACVRERGRKSAVAAHSFHSNVRTHLGLHGNLGLAPTWRRRERKRDEGTKERGGEDRSEGRAAQRERERKKEKRKLVRRSEA